MEIEINHQSKLATVWLAQGERENPAVNARLDALCRDCKFKKYMVAVFHSDPRELTDQPHGLPQGEYIQGMILKGRVSITQTSLVDAQALDILTNLSGNLGKITGMIHKTIIVNKEFAILDTESKKHLEIQMQNLQQLQSYIQHLAEDIWSSASIIPAKTLSPRQ